MAPFNSDIFIKIGASSKQATAAMNRVQAKVQSMSAAAQRSFADMRHKMGRFVPARMLQAKTGKVSRAINTATAQLDDFNNLQRTSSKQANSMADSFDAAALGVMFFGMQIQRIFTGIIRSGVKTFNSVMGQLEDTTTATDRLSGAFKFLKFEIGEALQPVMSFLVPIVAQIGEWVDANPKLARSILVVGAAVGSLLFAVGALQLGFKAISAAVTPGGFLYKGFTLIANPISTLSAILSGFAATIGSIVAAFLAIGAAIATNDTVWSSFNEDILKPITTSFKDLMSSLGMGDVNLLGILDLLATGFAVVGAILVSTLGSAIQVMISSVNSLIDALKGLFDSLKAVMSLGQAFWQLIQGNFKEAQEDYTDAVMEGRDAFDDFKAGFNEIVSIDDEITQQFDFVGDTVTGLRNQGGVLQTNSFGNAVPEPPQQTSQTDKETKKKQDKQIEEQKKTRQSINNLNSTMRQGLLNNSNLTESQLDRVLQAGQNTR